MICQFNKIKAPKFQLGADPLKYEEWVRRLENLFEIIECPDRCNVALVHINLRGRLNFGWKLSNQEGKQPQSHRNHFGS